MCILLTEITVRYAVEKLRNETLIMCMPQDTLVGHVPARHSMPVTTLVQENFRI